MDSLIAFLLVLTILSLVIGNTALTIYGVVLSFKKKWYIGLASLVVPLFAYTVGTAKFVFKKDLLK